MIRHSTILGGISPKNGNLDGIAAQGLTVVIPAYGVGPHLERVVDALRRQSLPVGRIIISHSGEGDPTSRFAGTEDITVLHSADRLYAGAARNRGLALASTEWVAFVDEDVLVDENWHAALQETILRGASDCIVGSIGYVETGGYWGMSLWFTEFSSVHPHLAPRSISSGASANLAAKRHLLEEIGGFPEDWRTGEDAFAQARLEQAGAKLRFEPAMLARHINRGGFMHLVRYSHLLGRGSAKLRALHPHLTGAAAVVHPVLSLGLSTARFIQIYRRALSGSRPSVRLLVQHTPGIVIGLLAWNAGFAMQAFARKSDEMDERIEHQKPRI